jgi:MoaA/NifB/PqqE/SkfB family radical SAM enzyme
MIILMKSPLRVFLDQLVPGQTAFPALSKIDTELGRCNSAAAAAGIVESRKPELYHLLRKRFSNPAAQALTLKIVNLCLGNYHLRARDAVLLSRPFGLMVDPSNMCQLACPGCVHSPRSEERQLFDWPKGTLAEQRFVSLLKRYGPFAVGIYFCDYGEPLLNMDTPKFIRLAKSYLMATALSTSLSVRRFDAGAYVESGLDLMILSIDGVTQPVYQRFRRNGNLELVFENVRKLADAKRRLRRRTPLLSWNFLAFEHNSHEIPRAERMARKLGVNLFRVVTPFGVGWDDPEVRAAAVKPYVRRLDWSSISNAPENWNPFPASVDAETIAGAFESPLSGAGEGGPTPAPGHTCHWLYKNMVMDATGRILPCCGGPPLDGSLEFAHVEDGDPFNSERYRQARSLFRAGASASDNPPYCARCEWDHTSVNIGSPEIRRYFRAADAAFFDRRSLSLLSA